MAINFYWEDDGSWEAEADFIDVSHGEILNNISLDRLKQPWSNNVQERLDNFENICLLDEIIILEELQRQGYGSQFLNILKDVLKDKDVDYIILEASPINHTDLEGLTLFYSYNDFEILEENNKATLMICYLND